MDDFITASSFENRFWLRIFMDHSAFLYDTLSPSETGLSERALQFKSNFESLHKRAVEMSMSDENASSWVNLAREAERETCFLRNIKLHIIRLLLAGNIKIGFTPSFINHMVNEANEFLKLLSYLTQGKSPPIFHPIHHHLLWLKDAEGHARTIKCNLDPTQIDYIKQFERYMKLLLKRYSGAVEMAWFSRSTGRGVFPSLGRFDSDTSKEIFDFERLLREVENGLRDKRIIGSLDPEIPNHMAREECYYLFKLSISDPENVKEPDCAPL